MRVQFDSRSWAIGLIVLLPGCGPVLLGTADVLDGISGGLRQAGNTLSPWEYGDLNGVFEKAVATPWVEGTVTLTSGPQVQVAAFYETNVALEAVPANYLNERWFRLDAPPPDKAIRVEFLSEAVNLADIYDADRVQFAALRTYGLGGALRHVDLPALNTATIYLRLNLNHIMETDEPLARLSWIAADSGAFPRPQTVVLAMSGRTGLTFRSGGLKPTNVSTVEDTDVRLAILQSFSEIFAPYNMTVLTDSDPQPAEPHSVIYIGVADPPLGTRLNGLSEWIDGLNQSPDDVAIVDLSSSSFAMAGLLGPTALGTAAGLVAAHEMGHLLGLSHTLDPDDLMTTGSKGIGIQLDRLYGRRFLRAPLDSLIAAGQFALGEQNPEASLATILGLRVAPPMPLEEPF